MFQVLDVKMWGRNVLIFEELDNKIILAQNLKFGAIVRTEQNCYENAKNSLM